MHPVVEVVDGLQCHDDGHRGFAEVHIRGDELHFADELVAPMVVDHHLEVSSQQFAVREGERQREFVGVSETVGIVGIVLLENGFFELLIE
jgi:hypothetical protein